MVTEHTPRVYVDDDLVLIRCVCGWRSAQWPKADDASADWADHIIDVQKAQGGEA